MVSVEDTDEEMSSSSGDEDNEEGDAEDGRLTSELK